jgi:hypothetical protein
LVMGSNDPAKRAIRGMGNLETYRC